MWHACEVVHTVIWWRSMKEGGNLKDLGIDGREVLKGSQWRSDEKAWTGFTWVKLETSGALL